MERHKCTKEDPWFPGRTEKAEHPDAVIVASITNYYEDWEKYECPWCKTRFKTYYEG